MKESFEASGRHKRFDYLWSENGLRMSQISMFQLTLRKLGLCVCSLKAFVECWLRKFLYKFLNELLKKSSPKVPYERILWSIWSSQRVDYLWSQNGLRMSQISMFQLTLRKTDSERQLQTSSSVVAFDFFHSTSLNISIWDPITCREMQETSVMMMH